MSFAMGQSHLFHTVGAKPHISHVFLNFIKNRRRLCPALGDYGYPYIFGLKLRASLASSPLCGYRPGGFAPHFPLRQLWRTRPHLWVLQLGLRQRTPTSLLSARRKMGRLSKSTNTSATIAQSNCGLLFAQRPNCQRRCRTPKQNTRRQRSVIPE